MHIAFLTPEYPHKFVNRSAGLATSIHNLALSLVSKGHKVSVFVYSQDSNKIFEDEGVTIHNIGYKKFTLFSWYFYRKYIQKYVNSILEKDNIDLIEAPDWTGITAFMKFNCPLVIRLHGSDAYFCYLENRKQKRKNFFFESKALKLADSIVSVSEFSANATKEIFGVNKEIQVIPNGIDIGQFSKSTVDIVPNSLLYFGAIIRKKGVLELALIFNEVAKQLPTAQLTMLGKDVIDIRENKSTISLFKELLSEDAKKNVSFLSEVPYSEVKNYIGQAAAVVLPSFAEAFPMTWLEAMAMQKAIVTSDVGWAKEIMIDEETGYMVDPKNHELYANKIVQLLKDSSLNKLMGEQARKQIENNFSLEIISKQNIEFYQNIINETT